MIWYMHAVSPLPFLCCRQANPSRPFMLNAAAQHLATSIGCIADNKPPHRSIIYRLEFVRVCALCRGLCVCGNLYGKPRNVLNPAKMCPRILEFDTHCSRVRRQLYPVEGHAVRGSTRVLIYEQGEFYMPLITGLSYSIGRACALYTRVGFRIISPCVMYSVHALIRFLLIHSIINAGTRYLHIVCATCEHVRGECRGCRRCTDLCAGRYASVVYAYTPHKYRC